MITRLAILIALAVGLAAAEGSAHAPNFTDHSLWPSLSGKEYFLSQKFNQGRVYTWAKPGQNGGSRVKGLSPHDAANWLIDGKAAHEVVFDSDTDVVFPASEKPYTISFRHEEWSEIYRHVTVGKGCEFSGGGDGRGRQVFGNIWIKQGASMSAQGATSYRGNQHTFVRNDNTESLQIAQYFLFAKTAPEFSVEFLGKIRVLDEFRVEVGRCIVGENSEVLAGRNAGPYVNKEGAIIVLSGGYWGKWCNEWVNDVDLKVRGGLIQGGLPERPLIRDAHIGLSFRNWKGLTFNDEFKDKRDNNSLRMVSATFSEGATIRGITAPGSQATLVLSRTVMADDPVDVKVKAFFVSDSFNRLGDPFDKKLNNDGKMGDAAFRAVFDSAPRGTAAWFSADTKVEGVRFDGFGAGAFLVAEAGLVKRWHKVTFGPKNIGGQAGVVAVLPQLEKGGYW